MRFFVCGPYTVPRTGDKKHVDWSSGARKEFWEACDEDMPGISGAHGCYVFAMKSGGGTKPWYVGKAETQRFKSEVFSPHKLLIYNEVVYEMQGTPLIYLLPRVTEGGKLIRFSKRKKPSISFVEAMLLGYAIDRNKNIKNKKSTSYLKKLEIVGLLGGHPGKAALDLRNALGLSN